MPVPLRKRFTFIRECLAAKGSARETIFGARVTQMRKG